MNLSTILNKFQTSTIAGINGLIDGSTIWKNYKQIRGNSRKTLIDFVIDNNLKYVIISRSGKKLDITIDDYNHRSHYIKIYSEDIVAIDDLEPIITALPDINPPTILEDNSIAIIKSDVIEEKAPTINIDIIELAEHEQFKDINGNVFEIEVRGERHLNKLFLKCMHIEEYFEIDQLTENIFRASSPYIENIDYIIITSLITDSKTKKSLVYLTGIGFIKISLASINGNNHNINFSLYWTFQFISKNDNGLSITLNSNSLLVQPYKETILSGIYLIKIGKVEDLRESMNISLNLYPDDQYFNANIYKIGRTTNIITRLSTHSKVSKYGKYSNKLELIWFVPILKKQLPLAEYDLITYYKNNNQQFKFTDSDGYKHNELIIIKPNDECRNIKTKYMQLGKDYPSSGKDLIDIWRNTVDETKKELANKQYEIEIKQLEFVNKINMLEYENQLKDKTIEIKNIVIENKDKDIRLLQMEMQIIKLTK